MPVPDQMMPELTPEQKAEREARWKEFGEMIKSMPEQPRGELQVFIPRTGIINASTKPGYDPLNTLPELTSQEFVHEMFWKGRTCPGVESK